MVRFARHLAACLLLGLSAAAAPAQPPLPLPPPGMPLRLSGGDGPFGDGPGMLLPLMLRSGDLTAEQEQKIRSIMTGDRTRLQSLFEQIDKANDALAAKLASPAPVDAAALAPDVDRIAALRADLLKQGVQSTLAIRAVLTAEQLARAEKKRTRLMELQREMRGLFDEK